MDARPDSSSRVRATRALALLGVLVGNASSCGEPVDRQPNVLFVVWDTTRADHLGLYGHDVPTTPFLDEWAKGALVFEDCIATAGSTVASHGSMFTGLLPREHGADSLYRFLDDSHRTLAELFNDSGYQTYSFAANPHISSVENFTQGFDVEQHPWDLELHADALAILRGKVNPADRSSELAAKIQVGRVQSWDIKACGELGNRGVFEWLDARDRERPYFAFLNYMEAHRPFVPSDEARRRVMTPDQVALSYRIDRSWNTMWSYTFGLAEYTAEELEVMARTYDACITELDDLLRELLHGLEARGDLDDTIVVVVGDHGEHLGEHHLLDHQYSIYQPLVHVPLVLSYPGKVTPGRSDAPVAGYDVFPTLLGLAGIPLPPNLGSTAVDLLSPSDDRWRLAETGRHYVFPIWSIQQIHADWDPSSFQRSFTTVIVGRSKLIRSSDGRDELYLLDSDPLETNDLASKTPEDLGELIEGLRAVEKSLRPFDRANSSFPEIPEDQRRWLEALGYFSGSDE